MSKNAKARFLERNEALLQKEFRSYLLGRLTSSFADRMLTVVIGYEVYSITNDTLALGLLGLIEAIPSLSIALFGGHLADRMDRRRIIMVTQLVEVACALGFLGLALAKFESVFPIYVIVFIAGLSGGIANPAIRTLYPQLLPNRLLVSGSAWASSLGQMSSILGPSLAGVLFVTIHAPGTIAVVACGFFAAWVSYMRIAPRPRPPVEKQEPIGESLKAGLRFVFRSQPIVGSMALDLFAVLFGGAVALFPVFAKDILHCGPQGLGMLSASPSIGALPVMLWSTQRPPLKNAGMILILCVAGFGVSIIVFGLSTNLWLSCAAMVFAGAFDGISMVIRGAVTNLMSPDAMRGRVAAVSSVFIGASNQLGAFESGLAARLFGTVPSVIGGGCITLLVAGAVALKLPKLRTLSLDQVPQDIE